jgi:Transposase
MADWTIAQGVTHVAMESTGVFWKPICDILESRFTMLLVNARHLKQVTGRKSDVRDCQWIALLLRYKSRVFGSGKNVRFFFMTYGATIVLQRVNCNCLQ